MTPPSKQLLLVQLIRGVILLCSTRSSSGCCSQPCCTQLKNPPQATVHGGQLLLNWLLEGAVYIVSGGVQGDKHVTMLAHHALRPGCEQMDDFLLSGRACWIKYNCPSHNAIITDRQRPPPQQTKVSLCSIIVLCEESLCPLSFGSVGDVQSGKRLRFQQCSEWATDTGRLLSRPKAAEFLMICIVRRVGEAGTVTGRLHFGKIASCRLFLKRS